MSAYGLEKKLYDEQPIAFWGYKLVEALRGCQREHKKEAIDLIWNRLLSEEEREQVGIVHHALKQEGGV